MSIWEIFSLVQEAFTCNALCKMLAKNKSLQSSNESQRIILLTYRQSGTTQNDELVITKLTFLAQLHLHEPIANTSLHFAIWYGIIYWLIARAIITFNKTRCVATVQGQLH